MTPNRIAIIAASVYAATLSIFGDDLNVNTSKTIAAIAAVTVLVLLFVRNGFKWETGAAEPDFTDDDLAGRDLDSTSVGHVAPEREGATA